MGVGFSIKIRPVAKENHQTPILTVKSPNLNKKRDSRAGIHPHQP